MRGRHGRAWLVGVALGAACTDAGSSDEIPSDTDTDGLVDRTACAEPTDLVGRPRDIDEAIAFVNALPRPVTLDCFVERLERPISMRATKSFVSLQPALGPESPRVFLFEGDLIMSVAVDGEPGRHLLEFGQLVGGGKSVKGEIEFPVVETLGPTDAFARVRDPEEEGTRCRICHGAEQAVVEPSGAFASDALRFRPEDEVPLPSLDLAFETCDRRIEPARCDRLDALFGWGSVVEGDFPDDLPTIYDYE